MGKTHQLDDVLDDLCSRFLINIPVEDLSDTIRICFAIEQAHWYYLDFYREEDPSLPSLKLRDFIQKMLKHYPPFVKLAPRTDEIIKIWKEYKFTVPVFGGMMLNAQCDKVLMVRGWGKHGVWGFPKGKKDQGEGGLPCAIREVEEETGYNFSNYGKQSDFVVNEVSSQATGGDVQVTTLYVAVGVPETTDFKPKSRKEISDIAWHSISKLPRAKKREQDSKLYWNVYPFVAKLLKWLESSRGKKIKKQAIRKAKEDGTYAETEVATFDPTQAYGSYGDHGDGVGDSDYGEIPGMPGQFFTPPLPGKVPIPGMPGQFFTPPLPGKMPLLPTPSRGVSGIDDTGGIGPTPAWADVEIGAGAFVNGRYQAVSDSASGDLMGSLDGGVGGGSIFSGLGGLGGGEMGLDAQSGGFFESLLESPDRLGSGQPVPAQPNAGQNLLRALQGGGDLAGESSSTLRGFLPGQSNAPTKTSAITPAERTADSPAELTQWASSVLKTPPARLGNPKPAGPIFKSFAFDRAKIMHACEAV